MYEGHAIQPAPDADEDSGLRRFRWTELVARLSASRDLHDDAQRARYGDFGAFGAVRRDAAAEGKPSFNHSALSDGKSPGASAAATTRTATHGDREHHD